MEDCQPSKTAMSPPTSSTVEHLAEEAETAAAAAASAANVSIQAEESAQAAAAAAEMAACNAAAAEGVADNAQARLENALQGVSVEPSPQVSSQRRPEVSSSSPWTLSRDPVLHEYARTWEPEVLPDNFDESWFDPFTQPRHRTLANEPPRLPQDYCPSADVGALVDLGHNFGENAFGMAFGSPLGSPISQAPPRPRLSPFVNPQSPYSTTPPCHELAMQCRDAQWSLSPMTHPVSNLLGEEFGSPETFCRPPPVPIDLPVDELVQLETRGSPDPNPQYCVGSPILFDAFSSVEDDDAGGPDYLTGGKDALGVHPFDLGPTLLEEQQMLNRVYSPSQFQRPPSRPRRRLPFGVTLMDDPDFTDELAISALTEEVLQPMTRSFGMEPFEASMLGGSNCLNAQRMAVPQRFKMKPVRDARPDCALLSPGDLMWNRVRPPTPPEMPQYNVWEVGHGPRYCGNYNFDPLGRFAVQRLQDPDIGRYPGKRKPKRRCPPTAPYMTQSPLASDLPWSPPPENLTPVQRLVKGLPCSVFAGGIRTPPPIIMDDPANSPQFHHQYSPTPPCIPNSPPRSPPIRSNPRRSPLVCPERSPPISTQRTQLALPDIPTEGMVAEEAAVQPEFLPSSVVNRRTASELTDFLQTHRDLWNLEMPTTPRRLQRAQQFGPTERSTIRVEPNYALGDFNPSSYTSVFDPSCDVTANSSPAGQISTPNPQRPFTPPWSPPLEQEICNRMTSEAFPASTNGETCRNNAMRFSVRKYLGEIVPEVQSESLRQYLKQFGMEATAAPSSPLATTLEHCGDTEFAVPTSGRLTLRPSPPPPPGRRLQTTPPFERQLEEPAAEFEHSQHLNCPTSEARFAQGAGYIEDVDSVDWNCAGPITPKNVAYPYWGEVPYTHMRGPMTPTTLGPPTCPMTSAVDRAKEISRQLWESRWSERQRRMRGWEPPQTVQRCTPTRAPGALGANYNLEEEDQDYADGSC